MADHPSVKLYHSRSHPPHCKWVPGWWDPICRVCQELKNVETKQRAEEKANAGHTA